MGSKPFECVLFGFVINNRSKVLPEKLKNVVYLLLRLPIAVVEKFNLVGLFFSFVIL